MQQETFAVSESVADLSMDISEYVDGTSSSSRDELIERIDELVGQLLDDPNLEMPVSMVQALEIGWKSALGVEV